MYRLLGRVRSRAQRTLWLLEELEAEYDYVSVAPRSPEAFALNPLGKVPILETPEGVILDSLAQMHFLADRHGAFTHPAGSLARAEQDAFSFAVLEMMDANLWAMALHGFGLPEELRLSGYGDTGRQMVTHFSGSVAELMAGDYAVGDSFTVADILLAHCSAWARGLKITLDPKVHDHMHRMRARPAFARAMAHEETAA